MFIWDVLVQNSQWQKNTKDLFAPICLRDNAQVFKEQSEVA